MVSRLQGLELVSLTSMYKAEFTRTSVHSSRLGSPSSRFKTLLPLNLCIKINYSKFLTDQIKLIIIERFSENISQLRVCWHEFQCDITFSYVISNEMMTYLDVLGSRMLHWILHDIYGACIVAMNWDILEINP